MSQTLSVFIILAESILSLFVDSCRSTQQIMITPLLFGKLQTTVSEIDVGNKKIYLISFKEEQGTESVSEI